MAQKLKAKYENKKIKEVELLIYFFEMLYFGMLYFEVKKETFKNASHRWEGEGKRGVDM